MTMADGPVPVADASTMRAYLAVALRRRDFFIPSTRRDRLHRGRLEPYRGETAFDFTNLIFMAA
jgi:hypothetical protein